MSISIRQTDKPVLAEHVMRSPFFFRFAALTLIAIGLSLSVGRRVAGLPSMAPSYEAVDGDPVDLGTGLYLRHSVDLVLIAPVPVIFSRTYRNRDAISRPFGIGTNHSFGSFLVGDAPELSYIDLILPDGGRVHYRRIAGGSGLIGAVYEHTDTPSEYRDSRLFWNGEGWTIQLGNGVVYTYPQCAPSLNKACTMSSYRDRDGNQIRMRHDSRMNLVRIETPNEGAIDLTYDTQDRIVLARSSYGQEVRYQYDPQGRLVLVTGADGSATRYGYDDRHQMTQIDEPGLSITNAFDSAERHPERRPDRGSGSPGETCDRAHGVQVRLHGEP